MACKTTALHHAHAQVYDLEVPVRFDGCTVVLDSALHLTSIHVKLYQECKSQAVGSRDKNSDGRYSCIYPIWTSSHDCESTN